MLRCSRPALRVVGSSVCVTEDVYHRYVTIVWRTEHGGDVYTQLFISDRVRSQFDSDY